MNTSAQNSRIQAACDCLQKGGVVLLPTDTVLGLAAKADCKEAIEKLYALKDRPRDKNVALMVADHAQIQALGVELNNTAMRLLNSDFMPGPLTIVLPLTKNRPDWLEGRAELAIRIPNHSELLDILKRSGPLLVTSANRSGLPTPKQAQDAAKQLTNTPDLILEGMCQLAQPSSIVNCSTRPPKIERLGAISRPEIEDIIGEIQ